MENKSASDFRLLKLEKGLRDVGNSLLNPPCSIDDLLTLLEKAENLVSKVGQDEPLHLKLALLPLLEALATKSLLDHPDVNIKLSVASCIIELSRISAPDQLYPNQVMMEIFNLVVLALEKLSDTYGRYYSKAVNILKNTSKLKFCNVLLDLECEELIIQIFELFFSIISSNHKHNVLGYMEDIMTLILEGSDNISLELLNPILASLSRGNKNGNSMKLGVTILRSCAVKLKPYLRRAVLEFSLDLRDYVEILKSTCEGEFDVHNVEENSLGTLDQRNPSSQQPRRPDEGSDSKHESVPEIGDGQPKEEAIAVPGNGASKDPASDNSVTERQIGIVIQTEGTQEQLLHQFEGMKQASDSGTSQKHVNTEDNDGKVSVSPHVNYIGAKDINFSEEGTKRKRQRKRSLQKEVESRKRKPVNHYGQELVELRIKVWWPMDKRFYEGVVRSFDPVKMKHKVLYVDGDEENLNLNKERWKFVEQDPEVDVRGPSPKKLDMAKLKVQNSNPSSATQRDESVKNMIIIDD